MHVSTNYAIRSYEIMTYIILEAKVMHGTIQGEMHNLRDCVYSRIL